MNVLFLHIPKTAGTTMRAVFNRQYGKKCVYRIGENSNVDIRRLRTMTNAELQPIRAVTGHMSFGLHSYLPGESTYITLLREPLSRALSDYTFVTSTPQHPLYQRVREKTLAEYMSSSITGQLENGQTRLLSGDCKTGETGISTVRPMEAADLDRALANIQGHFAFVGVQEHFDESLLLMARALRWQHMPFYIRLNVARAGSDQTTIDDTDRKLIESRNQLDIELYRLMNERLDEQIQNAGEEFQRELSTYRMLNRIYSLGPGSALMMRRCAGTAWRKFRRVAGV